jgi:hypothetical protein
MNPQPQRSGTIPDAPVHIEAFAKFFKRYMSVSSVVTASLPIPLSALQLIPSYAQQTKFLATYTSLFCFLLLAFIFHLRHPLARGMFGHLAAKGARSNPVISVAPLALIVASLALVFAYHAVLEKSVRDAQDVMLQRGIPSHSMQEILANTDSLDIPKATTLIGLYLGMFMTAEAAFTLMALREYLQDLLGIREEMLIGGERAEAPPTRE